MPEEWSPYRVLRGRPFVQRSAGEPKPTRQPWVDSDVRVNPDSSALPQDWYAPVARIELTDSEFDEPIAVDYLAHVGGVTDC